MMEIDIIQKKKALLNHLIETGVLKTPEVVKAFDTVPREIFVPEEYKNFAYADEPLPIGAGQTISAPHMVAMMTELLEPKKTDKVLEIGAGSGYQAAILSKLVKKLYTVELEHALVEDAKGRLEEIGANNVVIKQGDGAKGWKEHAPFDKIIMTCGAERVPEELLKQLKVGGRLVAPIGFGGVQTLTLIIKRKGRLEVSEHGQCVFVPLRTLV